MRPLKTYGRKEEAKVERESKPYTFSRILKHKVILTVPKKYTVNILRQSTNTVIKNMRKKIQKTIQNNKITCIEYPFNKRIPLL